MLRATLRQLGLLGVARRGRELAMTMRFAGANRRYLRQARETLPIPPASLRMLVAASPDIAWFLESGRRGAESVAGILERNGLALGSLLPLLDFGCGCGRVLRHFSGLRGRLCGTDLHPRLVQWCEANLPFGTFAVNGLAPPTRFASGEFGLVYALSVFTHLPDGLQEAWMDEMRRLLRPGGHLVLTTHGARYVNELQPADRQRFADGQLVVTRDDRAGGNVCGAYHPESYVRRHLARGFTVVDFVPEGAHGNPWQDLWLLRKPQ